MSDGTNLKQYSVVVFEGEGEQVALTAGLQGVEFLFGMGKPLGEQNVFGDPFAMSSADHFLETKRRFSRGEMEQLTPAVKF